MKWIYLLLCLSLFCMCSVSERENIVNLTKEWSGKEVLFPKKYVLNVYLEDSVISYNKIEVQQYAILTYIDSIGCMSCKMNLPEWTKFIWDLDSISNRTIPCLFIFNPKNDDKKRMADLLRRTGFSYPVCVDERDSFNLLNKFPKDERFRTFLLNNENRVIAIGNPIHNPKVKELYLNIIQGNKGKSCDDSKTMETKVNIDNVSVQLGNFDWRKKQEHTFILKNVGDKPLFIEDVSTSCGCITVDYFKEPVRQGEYGMVTVAYQAERPEYFNKTITVYCNVETSPIKLTISGDARETGS